jgi:uncharacterized protein YndB with AHSA1/START domain
VTSSPAAQRILHAVEIAAPLAKVREALATAEGLRGWWSTRVETSGDPPAHHFTFQEGFNPVMEIEVDEPDRILWRCTAGAELWTGNPIEFRFREESGTTQLMFSHEYTAPVPDEVYAMFNYSWGYYLESLRLLCAEGAGKPHDGSAFGGAS